jgi:hypothetical protein
MTSALVFRSKERQRAQRFVKQALKGNQLLKVYQIEVINVTTLQAKQEIKRCDVTYTNSVAGLASQEVTF